MIVKLLTEHHLEFLSLKGGCTVSSKSTLVKMSNCWKSHAAVHFVIFQCVGGRYGPPVPQSGSTHFNVSSGGPRLELDCCDVQTSLNLHRSICHLVQMLDTSFSLSEHFVPWIKTWVKVLNFQNIELLKIKS